MAGLCVGLHKSPKLSQIVVRLALNANCQKKYILFVNEYVCVGGNKWSRVLSRAAGPVYGQSEYIHTHLILLQQKSLESS